MTNLSRIERTRHELGLLSDAIGPWLQRRKDDDRDTNDDYLGYHQTQLQSIGTVLTESVTFLKDKLAQLTPGDDAGEVYLECRDIDETIVWVQRVWDYFKEKFDQRDDQRRTGPLLKAADEVVWSCYSQVFVQAAGRPGVEKRPPPLSFIEPQYSPAAVESDRPLPPDLRLSAEVPFVSEFIKTLPVAVVSLPPWCIDAPWWLIYLAHETGHHVLHDLKLTAHFRDGMTAAAGKKLPAAEAAAWGRWAEEIFADIFSVLMVGEWAVWAVAEAERGRADEMVRRKDRYPSPIIRLALLAQAARAVGVDPTPALVGVDARALLTSDATARRDAEVVPGAVEFALGPLRQGLEQLTLPELCGLGKGPAVPQAALRMSQKVSNWADHLGGQSVIQPQRQRETAREVVSASVRRWKQVSAITEDADRVRERDALALKTKQTLRENAPKGVRAGATAPAGKGEELVRGLLAMTRQRRAQG